MSELEEALSRIAELEKILSEVSSCKIGNLVVYNPNGEDKDAKFVAMLVGDTQKENDSLKSQLKVAEAKFAKSVEVIEVILDEISLNIRPKKPTDEADFKKMFNWIKSELASITAETLSSIGEKK